MPGKRFRTSRSAAPSKTKTKPESTRAARTLDRALKVLARTRRGESLSEAARKIGIKPATVRKRPPKHFHQDAPGKRWKPSKSDRLTARMNIVTRKGLEARPVRGSKERSRVGRHSIAVRHWREGRSGAAAELATFEGQTAGGLPLLTDVTVLAELEDAGELDFPDLYASLAGGA